MVSIVGSPCQFRALGSLVHDVVVVVCGEPPPPRRRPRSGSGPRRRRQIACRRRSPNPRTRRRRPADRNPRTWRRRPADINPKSSSRAATSSADRGCAPALENQIETQGQQKKRHLSICLFDRPILFVTFLLKL